MKTVAPNSAAVSAEALMSSVKKYGTIAP